VFFAGTEDELARSAREIILDFPGGGFIAMNPAHHEERLRFWAVQTRKVVVAIDYGKAPECMLHAGYYLEFTELPFA